MHYRSDCLVCPGVTTARLCDVLAERQDLVRGFQHAKDQYVPITEQELDSLEAEANKSIDLKQFIPLDSVDPVYFENTHYLPPLESYLRHVVARQEHDTTDHLKDINVPTLVLVGSDDHVSSTGRSHRRDADILVRDIPNASFVEIPGEAHNYFFTNPDPAHKAIREFLAV